MKKRYFKLNDLLDMVGFHLIGDGKLNSHRLPWSILSICFIFMLMLTALPAGTSYFIDHPQCVTSEQLTIDLDCNRIGDLINPYVGINAGPLPNPMERGDGTDLTAQYQMIGITHVRVHDFWGPGDIDKIFPDWDADPTLPSSYDFSKSNEYISAIADAGCRFFYRLGVSATDDRTRVQPPGNMSKWAQVCKHIAMHYNDGWANGYHYSIIYWEIWNEPDLSGFWTGTPQQYYELYATTARTLKSYNDSLKVGGPATSSIDNPDYSTGFLSYVTENDIPLDFYSWHCYATKPNDLYCDSIAVRNMLDSYGLTNCENIDSEWNNIFVSPQRDRDNAKNAAFTACSLISFQDAALDCAFRYRGTQFSLPLSQGNLPVWWIRYLGGDFSLFMLDGTPKTPALTYLAMHYLINDTPIRFETPPMDASAGITYIAGISEDQTNITFLISNYNAPDTDYELTITDLPWNNTYNVAYYLIDNDHHLEIIENETVTSPIYTTSQELNKDSIQFIRLTNMSILPKEGPPVAKIPFLLRLHILDPITAILFTLTLLLIQG